MNTELTSNSNITYSGRVQITLKLGSAEYKVQHHNEGLTPLFKLLAFAIAGEKCDVTKPTHIDIKSADGSISKLATTIKVSAVTPIKNIDGTYGVRVLALMQDSDLLSGVPIEFSDILVLMSNKYILAKVQLSEDEVAALQSITENVNGQIEWTMTIKNAAAE